MEVEDLEEDWDAHFSVSDDSPEQLVTTDLASQFYNQNDEKDEEDWGAHFESVPNDAPGRNELSTDDVLEEEEDWGSHFSVGSEAEILGKNMDHADSVHSSSSLSAGATQNIDKTEKEISKVHLNFASKQRSDRLDEPEGHSKPQTAPTNKTDKKKQKDNVNAAMFPGLGKFYMVT